MLIAPVDCPKQLTLVIVGMPRAGGWMAEIVTCPGWLLKGIISWLLSDTSIGVMALEKKIFDIAPLLPIAVKHKTKRVSPLFKSVGDKVELNQLMVIFPAGTGLGGKPKLLATLKPARLGLRLVTC